MWILIAALAVILVWLGVLTWKHNGLATAFFEIVTRVPIVGGKGPTADAVWKATTERVMRTKINMTPAVPGHVPVEAAERMSTIRVPEGRLPVADWPERDPAKVWRMFRRDLNEYARQCVEAVDGMLRGKPVDFPEVEGINPHAAREEAAVALVNAEHDAEELKRPLDATDRTRLVEAFERWNTGLWSDTDFLSTVERILGVTAGRLGGKS